MIVLLLVACALPTLRAFASDEMERLERLVETVARLESQGKSEQAAEVRGQIRETDATIRQQLLERKRRMLARLQAEIDLLQDPASTAQVVLRIRLLRCEAERLAESGLPLLSIQSFLEQRAPTPVVDESGQIRRFLELLQREELMQVVAEPTLVTTAGREVSYVTDFTGKAALKPPAKVAKDSLTIGTRLRCLPTLPEDKSSICLTITLQHKELLPHRDTSAKAPSGGEQRLSSLAAIQASMELRLRSGQTVILGGLNAAGQKSSRLAMLLIIHAERIEPVSSN
jgi:hypothetical protein